MHVKSNIFHVLLFSIILLVPANSLINAQEPSYDYKYQDNYSYYSYPQEKDNDSYYYLSSNDTKVQECEVCFLKETYKQLSDKQRAFFFDALEYEFDSIDKLCTLIVNEKISEQELEKILRHILVQIFDKKIGYKDNNDNNRGDNVVYHYSFEDNNRYYDYEQYLNEEYYHDDRLDYYNYDSDNYYKSTSSNSKIDKLIVEILDCVFPPLTISKNWFACDNNIRDCTADTFNKLSIEPTFDGPQSESYLQCTSEEECPINSSDANFKIKIDGNYPDPASLDALIGTEKENIDIDNGSYSVSEILKGQQEPFISKFDILDVGNTPEDIAYAQDKMLMYVADNFDPNVSILDTTGGDDNMVGTADDVIGTVDVGGNRVTDLAYAPDKMLMYVTIRNDDTVTILDTTGGDDNMVGTADDVIGTVDVGDGPSHIAYAPDKMLMYVTNTLDDTVTILDTTGGDDNMVGTADDVIGTVDVGDGPSHIAYAPDKMLMYVTIEVDDTVTILDTTGGDDNMVGTADDIVGTVTVSNNPSDIAYAPDKMLMYVTYLNDDTVTILDTTGGDDNMVGTADDIVGTVTADTNPLDIAYAPDKMLMYVTNADDTVTILDTTGGDDNMVGTADDVIGTVDVGDNPQGIAYAPDKMLMYVVNSSDDTVTILDTAGGDDNIIGTADDVVNINSLELDVDTNPLDIAYAQDKMLMYVTNADDTVTILDTAGGDDNMIGTADDVVGNISINNPSDIVYAQDKMLMYVTKEDATISILDTNGGPDNTVGTADDIVGSITVNDFPSGIAYAQDKMLMYVVTQSDNTVTILDTAGGDDNMVGTADDIVGTVNVSDFPNDIAYAQDKMLMYVVNEDTVTILDTAGGDDNMVGTADDVVGNISINNPDGIAYAQDKMLMYVVNANTVTILDTAGGDDNMVGTADDIVGTVTVGNFPSGIAYAPDKMLMYVTNINEDTVTILDTAGSDDNMVGTADDIVGTIAVGNSPESIVYAQEKMLIYVANSGEHTISIVSIPTIEQACQNSGFDTGDMRTYQSNDGIQIEQITRINFSKQCTGDIVKASTEIQQCVIDNYAVITNVLS